MTLSPLYLPAFLESPTEEFESLYQLMSIGWSPISKPSYNLFFGIHLIKTPRMSLLQIMERSHAKVRKQLSGQVDIAC